MGCMTLDNMVQVVDLYFMAALSKELALIPVIAKSDCMTADELTEFKSHVLARLMDPQVEGMSCQQNIIACRAG